MQGLVGCCEKELSAQGRRTTGLGQERLHCPSRELQSLCASEVARSVCWGACVRRKQVQVASWAEKWLLPKRLGWDTHTQVLLYLFRQGFSKPSPLCEKTSHKGKNASPFNLRNYRRQEDRVSSDKLGAGLAWLVAFPINISLPGLETQQSGRLEDIEEHPSWSSVQELTVCTHLYASA